MPRLKRFIPLTLAISLAPLLAGCGDRWGWYVVSPQTLNGKNNLLFLLGGLQYTVLLSVVAMVLSVILGLLVALPAFSKNRGLRAFNIAYVEFVRAIPPLVLILWIYYGLPIVSDIVINVFWAGVLAVAVSDSPFVAEIFRAGIQAVPQGQKEAAQSLGLPKRPTFRLIVMPQALRTILPALANQFVLVLKVSSLVSVIGLSDLTRRANELVTTEYRPLEIYTILIFEYLALVLIISSLVRRFEKRLNRGQERG